MRNTISAAATLAAGGAAGDRLLVTARFALAGFGLRGRRVADFFVAASYWCFCGSTMQSWVP